MDRSFDLKHFHNRIIKNDGFHLILNAAENVFINFRSYYHGNNLNFSQNNFAIRHFQSFQSILWLQDRFLKFNDKNCTLATFFYFCLEITFLVLWYCRAAQKIQL